MQCQLTTYTGTGNSASIFSSLTNPLLAIGYVRNTITINYVNVTVDEALVVGYFSAFTSSGNMNAFAGALYYDNNSSIGNNGGISINMDYKAVSIVSMSRSLSEIFLTSGVVSLWCFFGT